MNATMTGQNAALLKAILVCICITGTAMISAGAWFPAGNVPGGGHDGPPVVLLDDGANIVLSNGFLKVTINKRKALISSLLFKDFEMLNSGYYSMDGGLAYRNPNNCIFKVKTATPDIVDLAIP